MDKSAVARRVKGGGLHRVHRGVYAVGYRAHSPEERWMAAVLAAGAGIVNSGPVLVAWGAALSHRSAAALWELLPMGGGPIEVTVPGDSGRRGREGLRVHRSRTLSAADVTLRRRIPVTTPKRTIADLKRVSPRRLRRATRQAELLGVLSDAPNAAARTRSDLEDDFLEFLRHHDLPLPQTNVRLGRWEVDFLWRSQRLIVETDFYGYHRGSVAFEDDHQRDFELRRLGYAVHRYTGAQLRRYPAEIAAELGEILV